MDAAREAQTQFGAVIVIIKKTSQEYSQMPNPLPCPSVVVNGRIIATDDTVAYQALKDSILNDGNL